MTTTRRLSLLLAALAAAFSTACLPPAPPGPPPGPTERPIAFHLCRPGVDITVQGPGLPEAGLTHRTDASGSWGVDVPAALTTFNLFLAAEDYPAYGHVITGGPSFFLPDCQPEVARDTLLPAWSPVLADTGERGAVRVDGPRFARADGSTFQWRGTDGFLLYQRWLEAGAGIEPVVQDWLTCGGLCAAPAAPNVVRVLGMVTSFSHFWPQEHPDYYDQLRPFADHLWTAFHLRLEFVIFADAQLIMPDPLVEQLHAQRVHAALATAENVFLEVANEPFKNLPGGGAQAAAIGRLLQGRGPPVASGDYDDPAATRLDYITVHTPRDAEWPRKAKDLIDIPGLRPPVVGDEPMGFAEAERPGARSTSSRDAGDYAATCALFAAGCTFHSDAGLAYAPYGPVQAAAAAEFFRSLAFAPADAAQAPYGRGSEAPGCSWTPDPDGPVAHDDALELRSFRKVVAGEAYVVQVRTRRAQASPCPGWRVVAEPRPGLARLAR